MQSLMETIGYRFRDEKLLELALTHPSAAQENNQRLEFLGDAVLQLCSSHRLYESHREMHEGSLSRLRASLVQESALYRVAVNWGLGRLLRLGPGEIASGGREKPSILADAVEAVLGAVYLDGGLDAAFQVADGHILNLPAPPKARDYKSELQERTQKEMGITPTYRLVGQEGPPHRPVFTYEAMLGDTPAGQGSGESKKDAQREAARAALEQMAKEG